MAQTPVEDARALAESYASQRLLGGLPTIPDEAWARVAAGEVATGVQDTGGPLKRVWGVGVVSVPVGAFLAALSDDLRKPAFTGLAHAEVLSGTPCESGRVVFQYLDVSVLSDRWWVVSQRTNPAIEAASGGRVREMVWSAVPDAAPLLTPEARTWADKGLQVTATEGSWLLADTGDGRTLVEYVQSSDPGGSVPAGLAATMAARSLPETFAAMTKMATTPASPPGGCPAR